MIPRGSWPIKLILTTPAKKANEHTHQSTNPSDQRIHESTNPFDHCTHKSTNPPGTFFHTAHTSCSARKAPRGGATNCIRDKFAQNLSSCNQTHPESLLLSEQRGASTRSVAFVRTSGCRQLQQCQQKTAAAGGQPSILKRPQQL